MDRRSVTRRLYLRYVWRSLLNYTFLHPFLFCFPEGETTAKPPIECGSRGRPHGILSISVSTSLRLSMGIRNSSLVGDLYWILTLRFGMSAILRFDGVRPNVGFTSGSRILRQIRHVVSCMEVWSVFFLVLPTGHCCRCRM